MDKRILYNQMLGSTELFGDIQNFVEEHFNFLGGVLYPTDRVISPSDLLMTAAGTFNVTVPAFVAVVDGVIFETSTTVVVIDPNPAGPAQVRYDLVQVRYKTVDGNPGPIWFIDPAPDPAEKYQDTRNKNRNDSFQLSVKKGTLGNLNPPTSPPKPTPDTGYVGVGYILVTDNVGIDQEDITMIDPNPAPGFLGSHDELTGVTPNQHHKQQHDIDNLLDHVNGTATPLGYLTKAQHGYLPGAAGANRSAFSSDLAGAGKFHDFASIGGTMDSSQHGPLETGTGQLSSNRISLIIPNVGNWMTLSQHVQDSAIHGGGGGGGGDVTAIQQAIIANSTATTAAGIGSTTKFHAYYAP